jgi:hypothetical protein
MWFEKLKSCKPEAAKLLKIGNGQNPLDVAIAALAQAASIANLPLALTWTALRVGIYTRKSAPVTGAQKKAASEIRCGFLALELGLAVHGYQVRISPVSICTKSDAR